MLHAPDLLQANSTPLIASNPATLSFKNSINSKRNHIAFFEKGVDTHAMETLQMDAVLPAYGQSLADGHGL